MLNENKIVQSLWIGNRLENLELLTLKSFVACGHEFHLYLYDTLETPIPEGVILKDANLIIPKDKIFSYKNKNEHGHGKGSFAGFSDIFRYKLLYEKGGWWVDMDVTCLKYLDMKAPYFFRKHGGFLVVNNMIKCPPKSDFMRFCYQKTLDNITENNKIWMLPSQYLSEAVEKFNLQKYISSDTTNLDTWKQIQLYLFQKDIKVNKKFYAIHWMNERWRKDKINKAEAVANTYYATVLEKYNLPYSLNNKNISSMTLLKNRIYLFIYYLLGEKRRRWLKKMLKIGDKK
jgi:hypothetical protein